MKEMCEAVALLRSVAEPKRGGLTAYRFYHVFKALELMSSGPIGRPRLERELRISEASVKTLLKRLREVGLVRRISNGHVTTNKGKEVVSVINSYVKVIKVEEAFHFLANSYVVLVKNLQPPEDLTDVYRIRDHVVREGCRSTIIIGGVEEGEVSFPGVPEEIGDKLLKVLKRILPPVNRGVIIIVDEGCLEKAFSATFSIVEDVCM